MGRRSKHALCVPTLHVDVLEERGSEIIVRDHYSLTNISRYDQTYNNNNSLELYSSFHGTPDFVKRDGLRYVNMAWDGAECMGF